MANPFLVNNFFKEFCKSEIRYCLSFPQIDFFFAKLHRFLVEAFKIDSVQLVLISSTTVLAVCLAYKLNFLKI